MRRYLLLLSSALLLASTAHAQVTFGVGPQVSISRSTLHSTQDVPMNLTARTGLEAGLRATFQVGHFAFQPAVLYAQRGIQRLDVPLGSPYGTRTNTRLDYLNVPLHVAYTQRASGQGLQVFAGPYLAVLLGGRNEVTYRNSQETGQVVVTTEHTTNFSFSSSYTPDHNFYARRLDVGAQAGLGYRLGGVLVQLSYSMGLRSISPAEYYSTNGVAFKDENPGYRNRSAQASLSYLFGPKS